VARTPYVRVPQEQEGFSNLRSSFSELSVSQGSSNPTSCGFATRTQWRPGHPHCKLPSGALDPAMIRSVPASMSQFLPARHSLDFSRVAPTRRGTSPEDLRLWPSEPSPTRSLRLPQTWRLGTRVPPDCRIHIPDRPLFAWQAR